MYLEFKNILKHVYPTYVAFVSLIGVENTSNLVVLQPKLPYTILIVKKRVRLNQPYLFRKKWVNSPSFTPSCEKEVKWELSNKFSMGN